MIYVPLNEWWAKVFETGKFPVLEKLVTAALSIFTGPHVEASFSLMKHIIDPKANRTCVHTYSSIMDIKYHMPVDWEDLREAVPPKGFQQRSNQPSTQLLYTHSPFEIQKEDECGKVIKAN